MKVIKFFAVAIVAVALTSCNGQSVTNKSLETELDSVSYAIGLDMAVKLKSNFDEADQELFVQGYLNGMSGENVLIEEKDINGILSTFFKNKQQRDAAKKAEAEFGEAKKEGEAFLEANKTNEGVQVTESGLQYVVLTEGTGEQPTTDSKVKVHYHGTLIDGTVFDSSVDRGEPTEFGVSQVIKGWTEGLQLMKVGAKYKFFIPQELAYGANPRPGVIKPFMPLVFEVELLEIK